MAATTLTRKGETVVRFLKPLKGIANRDRNKRLPELSSEDIEVFFLNADSKTKTKKHAA
ncbi:MAG: hypothetical protein ACU0CY_13680 [Maritimibacter harenae]